MNFPPLLQQILMGGGIKSSNPLPGATPPFFPVAPAAPPQPNAPQSAPQNAPQGFFGKADAFLQNPFIANLLAQEGTSLTPTGGPLAAIGRASLLTSRQKQQQGMDDLQRRLIEARIKSLGAPSEGFVPLTPEEKKAMGIPEGSFAQKSTTTGQIKIDDPPNTTPLATTTVNTGDANQTLANTLAKEQAKSYVERRPEAQTAISTLATVNNARQQVEAGIKSGQFANFQLGLAKTLNALGLTEDESVANTETFLAQTAGLVGQAIKQFGAGTGLSDADREFATRMAGGDIKMDEASIRRILRIQKQVQENIVKRFNEDREALLQVDPALAPLLGPALDIPKPQAFPTGRTAVNDQTGERLQEMSDGKWVPVNGG